MLLSTKLPETSKNFTQIYLAYHISENLHFCSVLGHQVTGQSRIRSRVQELIAVQILCAINSRKTRSMNYYRNYLASHLAALYSTLKHCPFQQNGFSMSLE